jgi:hypothetical protein
MSKQEMVTTPQGSAMYPYLKEPVSFSQSERKQLPDEDGSYLVDLVLNADEAQGIMSSIDRALDSSFEKAKEMKKGSKKKPEKADAPYQEMDDDTGEPNGKLRFRFKLKGKGKNPKTGKTWQQRPAIFNCKGVPYPSGTEVWGGSQIKVAFEMIPYFMNSTNKAGVSLRLKAVQVIDLVSGVEKTADNFGFVEEEGTANTIPEKEVVQEEVMLTGDEDF